MASVLPTLPESSSGPKLDIEIKILKQNFEKEKPALRSHPLWDTIQVYMEDFFREIPLTNSKSPARVIFTINVCLRHPIVDKLESIFIPIVQYQQLVRPRESDKGFFYHRPHFNADLGNFIAKHKQAVIIAEREAGSIFQEDWPPLALDSSLVPLVSADSPKTDTKNEAVVPVKSSQDPNFETEFAILRQHYEVQQFTLEEEIKQYVNMFFQEAPLSSDSLVGEIFAINVCLRHPVAKSVKSIFISIAEYMKVVKKNGWTINSSLNDFTVKLKNAVIEAERKAGAVIESYWPPSAQDSSLVPLKVYLVPIKV